MEDFLTALSVLFIVIGACSVILGAAAACTSSQRACVPGLITISSRETGAVALLLGAALLTFSFFVLHMLN